MCIDFNSIVYSFYVTVIHVNDKNDRSEKPSFKMFSFYEFYDAEKNNETFKSLVEYVKKESAA